MVILQREKAGLDQRMSTQTDLAIRVAIEGLKLLIEQDHVTETL